MNTACFTLTKSNARDAGINLESYLKTKIYTALERKKY